MTLTPAQHGLEMVAPMERDWHNTSRRCDAMRYSNFPVAMHDDAMERHVSAIRCDAMLAMLDDDDGTRYK